MQRVHVVAGIVYAENSDKILIAKRPAHLHQGGLWEFPGGKVEKGELPSQALQRELEEELSITVHNSNPFMTIHHDYTDKQVFLDVWEITKFSGIAKGCEGQEVAWVIKQDLKKYTFPKANEAIITKLLGG